MRSNTSRQYIETRVDSVFTKICLRHYKI